MSVIYIRETEVCSGTVIAFEILVKIKILYILLGLN